MRIPGWLTHQEQKTLYTLAYYVPGPILEIGSWVGRSTSCIAYGVRDCGQPKLFVSVDIHVKPEDFRPYEDGIGFFYPRNATTPLSVVSIENFRMIEPILSTPGGSLRTLHQNLARLGLREFVQIINCDFRHAPQQAYKLIFCDVTHTPEEIAYNIPDMAHLISPGTFLACHDSTPENEACLRQYLTFRYSFTNDTLFVGEVA